MDFLDAIFSNIFIIIAILAGLSGLFGKNKGENDSERPVFKEQQHNRPTTIESHRPIEYERTSSRIPSQEVETVSIDQSNEWYVQLEQSRDRLQESIEDNKHKDLDKIKNTSLYKKDKKHSSLSVKQNLKSKHLIESFIMSEVLQQPMAKRKNRV
ncbi:hypothetical protein ACLIA0_01120 [Bacillaceae bacterium W0354]